MLQLIANAFKAIGAIFGWAKTRDADYNRPEVVAGKEASEEQKAKDATAAAIAKKDVEALRKEIAE